MHGCGPRSSLLVNAEVDSMGGVVDSGVGVGIKPSPHRAEIEKTEADIRQEYDVREERRRELEFLEKGGNPLDFFGTTTSLSVQSTSLTDQHAEHFLTSEAKGSFVQTASQHDDSVESCGRPGVPTAYEPNCADNLLLFDGENEILQGEKKPLHPSKRNRIAQSEPFCHTDRTQNAKESEESAIFRPYARRNRSRINRDVARSSSIDVVQNRSGHGSTLPVSGGSKDSKGSISEITNQKDKNSLPVPNPLSAISNGERNPKTILSDSPASMNLDGGHVVTEATDLKKINMFEGSLDVTDSRSLPDNHHKEFLHDSAQQDIIKIATGEICIDKEREQPAPVSVERLPCEGADKVEPEACFSRLNGLEDSKGEKKNLLNDGQSRRAVIGMKELDSESFCTNSVNLDVNNDNDVSTKLKNVDSNKLPLGRTLELKVTPRVACTEVINKKSNTDVTNRNFALHDDRASTNDSVVKVDNEICRVNSGLQNHSPKTEEAPKSDWPLQESVGTFSEVIGDNPLRNNDKVVTGKPWVTVDAGVSEANETTVSGQSYVPTVDPQLVSGSLKIVDKAHEDSILEEARIIKAKRKRITELSVGSLPLDNQWKSHWDFVLEEMAWLANDFAQERLWKMTAAAQICHRVAFTSRLRFEEQNQCQKLKRVAFTIADAVMQFWHSTEVMLTSEDLSVDRKYYKHDFFDDNEASEGKDTNKELEPQYPRKQTVHAIQRYALRFLKYNSPTLTHLQAEAPKTPDRISDSGVMEVSWDDNLTEESLFYAVPLGAVEAYRKSIEFHILQREIAGSSVQEEVETSIYDPLGEFGYDNDEDEVGTSTYDFPEAFQGCKSSKKSQKRRRNSINAHTSRSYEPGADPYGNYRNGSQQSMLVVKRVTSNLNAGPIPTKRMRTASRHRVISPFGTGNIQTVAKIDASSGDTSPLKDDQSTLNGGSMIQKSIEIESVDDMERQLPYDCAETSMKPKKKKGSTYLHGWQQNSNTHNEQRDHFKRRFESHHFDSNGTNGLYGQHNAKKPKITKQALDNKYDNINPITRSIPSPVASQMSNMSNPNRPKSNGGRDRGRKTKGSKASASQLESETSWSHFEDQALVVVVHDMGSNWELVSDAVNDTFHFTCPYRNPKECSERHKIVIERGGGDGASSAEDSGSSQSLPSTLPGIPKGSARQLFERMREPMEGETLRFHFQNIIRIERKHHYRRSQNSRQILPVHNSHVMSLSQACPNNLNGGLLTPFDLCDVPASSSDAVPPGYQGSHSSGLPLSNQTLASVLPASGASSSLPGSSGMVLGGNMASPSSPLDTSVRDGRCNVARGSFPADEQHKLQQYSQIVSRRNMQQSSMSVSGGDRGVRMVPGGNGMGMTGGLSRGIPIPRPGFQGMTSSAMVNSGAIPSSSMVGMPNPVSTHSGAGSGQGNSMQRPRDMHMIRPGRNPEHQRQLMVQELQMQGTQGNNQGNPAYSGMSSAFSNQTIAPPVQSYPAHLQQHHQINPQGSHVSNSSQYPYNQRPGLATGPQQRPYPIHLPKERQRYMQQHQQQFVASGALMPKIQPQPQPPHPGSSSLHNSSQTHSQTSPQSVSLPPLTGSAPVTPISLQHQQKHSIPPHGLNRNSQSSVTRLPNQSEKQRPRQPLPLFQQSGRHHPHQRQQTPSQQQAKHLKGMGRGNMSGNQSRSGEPLHLNGLPVSQGNQPAEKGEQSMHLIQGQGSSSESDMNPAQQARPLFPPQSSNHSQPQRKVFSGGTSSSSKQLQKIPSHADNSTQAQLPLKPSGHTQSPTHQSVLSNHQHLQSELHRKQVNQTQHTKRILQQSHQGNSDPLSKCQSDQTPSELRPVNTASQMGTSAATAVDQACIDSDKIVAAGSSAVASQQKVMEPVVDSGFPRLSPKVRSIGSPSITNSARSDSESSVSQGIGQRQTSSGSLPSHGHNVGAQQKQHEVQQTHEVPEQQLQLQDLPQSPQQLQSPKQSHQHIQHLQASPGSVLLGASNSKAE